MTESTSCGCLGHWLARRRQAISPSATASTGASVIRHFKQLAAGKAAVFVTHNLESARIADRIIVLDGGRVREEGDFQTLLDS